MNDQQFKKLLVLIIIFIIVVLVGVYKSMRDSNNEIKKLLIEECFKRGFSPAECREVW